MKKRVLGAAILIAIIVPLLIIGGIPFKLLVMLIGAFGMYELMKVRKKTKDFPIYMQIIACLFVLVAIYFGSNNYASGNNIHYELLIIPFLLFLVPVVLINDNDKYNINDALYLLGSSLFMAFGFNTFIIIRNIDLVYIIYLALVTIMTDMFAYFIGRLIGKHKLCEKISPNKTIEGSLGGLIVGTIVPVMFYIFVINPEVNIFLITLLTLLFSVIGQLGDLLFSSIKRTNNIKDFSNLIPGHGGILDRFDSLLLVAITYMLFISIL